MKFFSWQLRTLLLSAEVAVVGAAFTSGAWAQGASSIPFVVNVDATVRAEPRTGAPDDAVPVQISVTGGEEAILSLPLLQTIGVSYFAAQRQTNAPAIVSSRAGKVTVNLPAQSYKNAEVALYTVNGKRILRQKVSATGAANNISRQNIATGAYLLSVKGTGGKAVTSRLSHSGGGLDISVLFGNVNGSENLSDAAPRLAKTAAALGWTIIVSATTSGYRDTAYTLQPTAATHAKQNITLRAGIEGTYSVRVSSVGTGATGSNNYGPGSSVSITAGTAPSGYRFKNWTTESDGVSFVNENNTATTFVMPENTVVVTANFELIPKYAVIVESVGTGASGGGSYVEGVTVSVNAGTAPTKQRFKNWTSESEGVTFADTNNTSTSFRMPAHAVTVTANFEPNTFKVTVLSDGAGASPSGGGDYYPGDMVTVRAGTIPGWLQFTRWSTTSSGNITFENSSSVITAFTMPASAVTVWAEFKQLVVDPNTVIKSTFTDNRDGQTYNTVKIGGQNWMAENLNYETVDSWCYDNSPDNCAKYGRLYTWAEAESECPSGWHLPYSWEWDILVEAAGGKYNMGTVESKLSSMNGWDDNRNGTDDYGFSALPGGIHFSDKFAGAGSNGYWWTATSSGNMKNAYYRSGIVSGGNTSDKNDGYSVRCVQDD